MKRVLIIQEHMPAFRVGFYETLREKLATNGVELDLIYAPNQRNTFLTADVPWSIPVPIHWIGGKIGWQSALNHCRGRDLVIIQQESKYLLNPVLQLWRKFGGPKVAYWGHGKNFQASNQNSSGERLKRFMARHVDWWFAYNDLCASVIEAYDFPSDRITSVGNAVDTTGMQNRMKGMAPGEVSALREAHGIRSDNVAVYTGGLYPSKRIGFLLDAARKIRNAIPDFELVIIGDGPERPLVTKAAQQESWIHDIGPKNDHDKVPFWAMAKLLLMPGLVGLVVVDSFALGVPLVTTDYPFHSPEIDYLKDGENGCIVKCGDDTDGYANAIVELFRNPDRIAALKHGAARSAEMHTIENMAENFASGVLQCIQR